MEDEKVSVIIPIYNAEKYINRCVDSILNQTYQNLEVILVDDGSTDESLNICYRYSERDKRVITFHKENGGPSSARNFALDNVSGSYVCFVDSDDYMEKDMIKTMVESLKEKNADDAICLSFVDDEKEFDGDIYNNILEDRIGSQLWRHLFKVEKFDGIRFPMDRFAEDMAVLDRILYKSTIVYVPKRLYYYNFSNQSNVSNDPKYKYKNIVDRAIAFSNRYNWVKDKVDIDSKTKDVILYKATSFCLSTFIRCKDYSYNAEDMNSLLKFLKENKKKIIKLKGLSFKKKIAIKFLCSCPKIFCTLGATITKRHKY